MLSLVGALTMVTLVLAGSAAAHYDTAPYIYRPGTDCAEAADPINFVFYGDEAWAYKSDYMVGRHMGWGATTDALDGDLQFLDHGICETQDFARASASFAETRYHIRLHRLTDRDLKGRWETMGDAHFEDITNTAGPNPLPCHAVRENNPDGTGGGFNQARDAMSPNFPSEFHTDGFDYNYPAFEELGELGGGVAGDAPDSSSPYYLRGLGYFFWGNTAPMMQCDDGVARSDGTVVWKSMYSGDGI